MEKRLRTTAQVYISVSQTFPSRGPPSHIFIFCGPRNPQNTMNKTVDGLHVNEIDKSFVDVNARARFHLKISWTVWIIT